MAKRPRRYDPGVEFAIVPWQRFLLPWVLLRGRKNNKTKYDAPKHLVFAIDYLDLKKTKKEY